MGGFVNRMPRLAGTRAIEPRLDFSLGPEGGREPIEQILPMLFQSAIAGAAAPNVAGGGPADIFRSMNAGSQRVAQIRSDLADKERQKRQEQLEDIDIQSKLAEMGRPVVGGMVEEEHEVPDTGILPGGSTMKVGRKPDASRVVKHKTIDGRTLEYEMYTPEEKKKMMLAQRQAELKTASAVAIQQARAVAGVQQEAKTAERNAQLQAYGIRVPEGMPGSGQLVMPGELNEIITSQTALNKLDKTPADKFEHWSEDPDGNVYGYRESGEIVDFGPRGKGQAPRILTVPEIAANSTNPDFSPAVRARWKATLDALQNNQNKPVAGRDIPFPKAVEEQRNRMNAARAQQNGLSPQQSSQAVSTAGAYGREPIVKAYNETANRVASVRGILGRPLGGPGDLAVVFEFMKGLDPTSVVRESEYANAASSGNIFAGWAARFNGYLKPEGGFLPENVKHNFLNIIEQKMDVSKKQSKRLHESYAKRIDNITKQPGTGVDYLTDYTELLPDEPAGASGDLSGLSTDELFERLGATK